MKEKILTISDLSVRLRAAPHTAILHNVSLDIERGSIFGVVGGSGSGKTTLGLALLGLLPGAMASSGKIIVAGKDITALSSEEKRALRGAGISMAFQEPLSAFDPVFTVGYQIKEMLEAHQMSAGARVHELLSLCGIKDPGRVAASYPHELSGGLRQRAMIALAIACQPKLLIADEVTSSLDVMLQAEIMELFRSLRKNLGLTIMLISHDLGVIKHLADDVVILRQGRVIEKSPCADIFKENAQGYTKELIRAAGLTCC
ncbi:MAG: ABC transporter ATP-binding protein [Candidatus Omnitrophica bacterium]|nr:ABC transporter ATP-binding protein [Candidatus Omnitrophota bacterium]